ncbi:hypothetical protein [Saccharolobus islandicus]|uniref:hypothetical protein n=1 Tax=Saccharolobus islandicus TaxID=43080 RepID=UPI00035F0587|nr:hypothetical protein [Sulfolobus islandicus]
MLKKIARINERGTHNAVEYYYVLDQEVLKPLSEYVIKKEYDELYEYFIVDDNRLKGKPIIEFLFANNGYLLAREYTIDDFNEKGNPDFNKGIDVNPLYFCEKFMLRPNSKREYEEFKNKYIPMIREIKEYISKMGVEILFAGHQLRVEEAFRYECPIGCLAEYGGVTRCLRNVKRWIYQLWVMKLVFEAIDVKQFLSKSFDGKPYIWLEQGNPMPATEVFTPYGTATFWFEFQFSKGAHGIGLLEGRKISVRPDIVFMKGEVKEYYNPQILLNSISGKNIIIECKEEEYSEWGNKIISQINDYRAIYNPKYLIVTSLKSSPKIKNADETFSNLQLGSKEVERFKDYIRDIFIKST